MYRIHLGRNVIVQCVWKIAAGGQLITACRQAITADTSVMAAANNVTAEAPAA